jgi:hypothetical protein
MAAREVIINMLLHVSVSSAYVHLAFSDHVAEKADRD